MQTLKGSGMPKLMNIQMELRKCCNHPFLINGVEQNEMVSYIFLSIICPFLHVHLTFKLDKILFSVLALFVDYKL